MVRVRQNRNFVFDLLRKKKTGIKSDDFFLFLRLRIYKEDGQCYSAKPPPLQLRPYFGFIIKKKHAQYTQYSSISNRGI